MFIFPVHCIRATQTGVYLLADKFSFQQFNYSPTTQEWVTATAGLAADQLVALLRDAAVRRCATTGRPAEMREAWEAAVADVHAEYFEEYALWQQQLQLPEPVEHVDHQQQQQGRQRRSSAGGTAGRAPTPQLLLELSLQFLIYTEAANLRHTPHMLFLIYYIMRGSRPFQEALSAYTARQPGTSSSGGLPQQQQQQQQQQQSASLPHTHWLYWLSLPASDFPDKPSGYDITSLRRNLLQQLYYTCPAAFQYPDPSAPVTESSESLLLSKAEQEEALDAAVGVMLHPSMTAPRHRAMVADMLQQLRQLFKGSGQQVFLNQVVQPLFFFLAEQIDLAGQQGQEEAALRIAYCDVDECCCSPRAVHRLLGALKEQAYVHLLPGSKDLWHGLLHVMKPPSGWLLATAALEQAPPPAAAAADGSFGSRPSGYGTPQPAARTAKDRYPRDAQRVKVLDNLAVLLQRNQGGDTAASARIKQEQDQALRHVIAQGFPALTHESEALTWVHQRAKHGADWWAANLFRAKTFVEARSVAAPFVAFWRVYNFHAVLFTAMVAVSFILRLKAPGAAGQLQLAAAFALTTVIDGLMRVAFAAARLLLLSYQTPVFRKQPGAKKLFVINPFTVHSWLSTLPQLLYMLLWLAWSTVLGFSVVPVLVQRDVTFISGLSSSLHTVHRPLWVIPVAVHVALVWGGAVLRQRAGYVTSWSGMWLDWQRRLKRRGQYGKGAMAAAHANCAADKAIDALFYPSSNLAIGKERWVVNTLLWAVVVLVKVVFEFFCIVQPLTHVMLQIIANQESFMFTALEANTAEPGLVTASTVLTIVALSVPAMLLSLSDTGLLFSLVGGAFSAAVGFRRGMGSIKAWSSMVSRFNILLDNYKQHCVSRSALALHLHGRTEADMQELCLTALAAGWNALAYDLRQRDLLSNRELACIAFEHLQLEEEQLVQAKARGLTTVLPARCFMAGAIPELASGVVGSDHHLWVTQTCWSWFCWLAYQTMLITEQELRGLSVLQLLYPPNNRKQQQRWAKLLSESVRLLRLLHNPDSNPSNTAAAAAQSAAVAAGDVFAAADRSSGAAAAGKGLLHGAPTDELARLEAWRDLTSCMASLIKALDKEVADLESARRNHKDSYSSYFSSPPPLNEAELAAVMNALRGLKARWTPWLEDVRAAMLQRSAVQGTRHVPPRRPLTREETRRKDDRDVLLERMQAVGRVSSAVVQVTGWLADVLTLLPGDTVPSDEEAVKFILNFAASLNDPGLKLAPALHVMPSLTTLTPHYDEDVIYALNEPDAMKDLQARAAAKATQKQGASNKPFPSDASKMASRDKVVYLMTSDGSPTPTMTYLRSVYCSRRGASSSQWDNFTERVLALAKARGNVDMSQLPPRINEFHFLPGEPLHKLKDELLLWASCRGQLLARTVRGMMSYRAALAALADYENPRFSDATAPVGLRPSCGGGAPASCSRVSNSSHSDIQTIQQSDLRAVILEDLIDCKYSYIVSSQNLGEFASKTTTDMKAAWLVHTVQLLRLRHPSLKVAFIDKQKLVVASRPGNRVEIRRDSSVLLCSERQRKLAAAVGISVNEEAYRVQLPINFESERGVILGEGKPENQNHAVIFCHSETLQTIDCNQDNVVAEGLKLRNLLAEFMPVGWDQPQAQRFWDFANALRFSALTGGGTAAAGGGSGSGLSDVDNSKLLGVIPKGRGRVALVGFREWVFSEDSGALAEFAAATERSFGTTVQRLMHYPGACRFHYGHPDVWRRSFVATCGGVSKANKALHVSEDVFGGYNVMLRGRDITYVDYIAVGKGRDMGFETINTFEAKIAAGNGEQVLSREIRRLGHAMDFARLMTWYHTGNGFFINTALTMLSVHASLWVLLLLAFEQQRNSAVQQWMSAVQLLQLGSLSVVVYWLTLALDVGLFQSVFVILRQMLQGSLMFYVFRAQTSAFNFTQDLMFGGAKYLPTGRGYKLQHTSYKDLWRRFGRSHMYFGAVLLQYCLAVIAAGRLQGAGLLLLWAPMLVVVSLLVGPFWFTPFAFRTKNVVDDLEQIQQWFMSPSITDSWQAWNKEWSDTAANTLGKQMGRLATCLRAHIMKLPSLLLILAATSRVDTRQDSKLPKWAVALVLAGSVLLLVSFIQASRRWAASSAMKYQGPRLINMIASILLAGGIAASGFATSGNIFEFGNAALVFFGTVLLLRLLPLVYFNPVLRRWMYGLVNAVYYAADWGLAMLLLCARFVLSVFDILTSLQAQLLFNTAYARQVMSDSSMESSQVPQLITQALKLKRQKHLQ